MTGATEASATISGLTKIASYGPSFGSAHRDAVEDFLDSYYSTKGVTFLGRLEGPTVDLTGSPLSGLGATFTGTGLTTTSGTWTLTENLTHGSIWNAVAIEINAGSTGLLYDIDVAGLDTSACTIASAINICTGSWDTSDIIVGRRNHPDLSHIDIYGFEKVLVTNGGPKPTRAPEPSSLAMVVTSLLGVYWMGGRRKAKIA